MGAIIYDETPEPAAATLAAYAAALGLPARDWTVIRLLRGRVVALGMDRSGTPDLVLRAGGGPRHAAHLTRAAAAAAQLARLLADAGVDRLVVADPSAWRGGVLDGVTLLSSPYVVGEPLAPERRLVAAETDALADAAPDVVWVVRTLRSLTDRAAVLPALPGVAPFDGAVYTASCLSRTEGRLRELVATDALAPAVAARIAAELARRMEAGPVAPAFAHGELTAWHILRRPDGGLALIDLETTGGDAAAEVDTSVFVMRTWGLADAEPAARAFLSARRAAEPDAAARERFDAETAWHWPYAAVRIRAESRAWAHRGGAAAFWRWALAGVRVDDGGAT